VSEIPEILSILQNGVIELKGQFLLGSNYTFLVQVTHEGQEIPAVYKPQRGEQPLWDFPENSLARREVAAFLLCRSLGWDFVPATVFREDGPLGSGSLQQYVEHDHEYHYFNFNEIDRDRLRPVALFDLLANNADRKGSHIMIETGTGKLWLIDHGLCFHVEDKLRTVVWDFAGQPISPELLEPLRELIPHLSGTTGLAADLQPFLSPGEIVALAARAERLLANPIFPDPPADRRAYPWPPV
jgi:uncharacterized repeat protein (TIGR03843 family)